MPTNDRFVGRKMLTFYQCGKEDDVGSTYPPSFAALPGCYIVPAGGGETINYRTIESSYEYGARLVGVADYQGTPPVGAVGNMVGLIQPIPADDYDLVLPFLPTMLSYDYYYWVPDSQGVSWIYPCLQEDCGNPPEPPNIRFGLRPLRVIFFDYPVTSIDDVVLTNTANNYGVSLPSTTIVDNPLVTFESNGLVDMGIIGKYGFSVFSLYGLDNLNLHTFTVSHNGVPGAVAVTKAPNLNHADGGVIDYVATGIGNITGLRIWKTDQDSVYLIRNVEYLLTSPFNQIAIYSDAYVFITTKANTLTEVL